MPDHVSFCLEEDDHQPVDSDEEALTFTLETTEISFPITHKICDMYTPDNRSEELAPVLTKNLEFLIQQPRSRPQKFLQIRLCLTKKSFSYDSPFVTKTKNFKKN